MTERNYVVYANVYGWGMSVGAAETCALGVGLYSNDTAPERWIARGVTTTEGGRFKFRSPIPSGWLHLPGEAPGGGEVVSSDGDSTGTGTGTGASTSSGGVASHCVDHSTGLPLPAPLVAPPGWRAVSPLSTAAASLAGLCATHKSDRQTDDEIHAVLKQAFLNSIVTYCTISRAVSYSSLQ